MARPQRLILSKEFRTIGFKEFEEFHPVTRATLLDLNNYLLATRGYGFLDPYLYENRDIYSMSCPWSNRWVAEFSYRQKDTNNTIDELRMCDNEYWFEWHETEIKDGVDLQYRKNRPRTPRTNPNRGITKRRFK
jgi:hypothetical protein